MSNNDPANGYRRIVHEFAQFLLHEKKWWLTPIIVLLLLAGLVIASSSSALGPFIYTLI